jgi:hypothetical protein
VKKKDAAVKRKRGKKTVKKSHAGKDSKKITPGKATVCKMVGKGKENRAKTCRKGS